jgi:hypothetical protein
LLLIATDAEGARHLIGTEHAKRLPTTSGVVALSEAGKPYFIDKKKGEGIVITPLLQ